MGKKTISPEDVIWQTPHYLEGVADGVYSLRCVLEMEPPIRNPIEVESDLSVHVKNGWISSSDAAIAVTKAVQEVGGAYNTIVGAAFVRGRIQLIVIWEHVSPVGTEANSLN